MNDSGGFRRLVSVLAVALIAGPLAAPSRAADNVSETRAISGFDRILLKGAFTTEISAGENRTRVIVSGSRDAVSRVTTEVQNGTLIVDMRPGNVVNDRAPKLEIALPRLRRFASEGAGLAKIAGVTGSDIAFENSGAGSIIASGRASHENIVQRGVGNIDTTALDAHDVTVENDGVGAVDVRASGALTMSLTGVGSIRYTGNPTHIESHANGIGSIGRR